MKNYTPFAVSYEKITSAEKVSGYKMIIIEPDHYEKANIVSFQNSGVRVVAYLSLGQVNPNRPYFPKLKERGFLGKNKNWNSYYINLADSVVRNVFKNEVLPQIMEKGFDGVFLDTINDSAPYTNRPHLQPYMVSLIKYIRQEYPHSLIIQNSGLFLLDKTSAYIDAVLIESVTSEYDFEDKKYDLEEPATFKDKLQQIDSLSTLYNKPFLLVEFADSDSLARLISARLDTIPFPYYIGNIQLNDVAKVRNSYN